jgi:hypothetical protein
MHRLAESALSAKEYIVLSPVWRSGGLRLSLFWQKLTVSCYLELELDSGGKSCYSGAYVSTGKPYTLWVSYYLSL